MKNILLQLKAAIIRLNSYIVQDKVQSKDLALEAEFQINDASSQTSSDSIRARRSTQVVALVPIYLLQFCYGMNSGYPAIITPQLQEPCSEFEITTSQESWIVSMENVVTPVICILSGYLQQKFGPKNILLISCLPYCLAWILAAVAPQVSAHVGALYASRLLVGISHAFVTTTVFTVEISSRDMRGTYSLWEAVLRSCGCLAVYVMALFMRWPKIALFAPIIPALALVWGIVFVPESPIHLIRQNKESKAEDTLKRLYGPGYKVKEEVDIIQHNLKELETKRKGVWKDLTSRPEVYKPFFIILLLSAIQQSSGMSVLRGYVVKIFDEVFSDNTNGTISVDINNSNCTEDIGEESTSDYAYISAIIIAIVRLFSSLLLSKLLTRYKRRSMYFISAGLTVTALIGFATCVHFIEIIQEETILTILQWASLASACALVFAVQLGVQTLPSLLSGELFTADVRPIYKGFARSFTCLLILVCLKTYPALESALNGVDGAFYLFALILASSMPIVYFVLPETKDIGLEMVQNYFLPPKTVFYVDLNERQDSNESSKTNGSL